MGGASGVDVVEVEDECRGQVASQVILVRLEDTDTNISASGDTMKPRHRMKLHPSRPGQGPAAAAPPLQPGSLSARGGTSAEVLLDLLQQQLQDKVE